MKIASWNVNSLRVRIDQVLDWTEKNHIDILAIQETKVTDELFPLDEIKEAGYYCQFCGQKTYNGVATLSKLPPIETIKQFNKKEQEEKRILLTRHESDLTVLNLYVVNGHSVDSDKYKYKLKWLRSIQNFIEKDINNTQHYIIVGDFNIAPEDRDVYSPQEWEERILCSKKERKALQDIMEIGLKDCFRIFGQDDNLYSWWDYRTRAFSRNNGLRIDLMLANNKLSEKCKMSWIDVEPRGHERPSDHAPVISEFSI
ncbi:MAG: exodeoxyribonuclease III [Gammaproteobacteria bacterium]|nr:exodeoxyribonuclease III [Gammaproteobacteria bacterium]|tara:strand:- start:3 stop:773 length:771 start_codon:yes stop_codon:yes gene_type:complete